MSLLQIRALSCLNSPLGRLSVLLLIALLVAGCGGRDAESRFDKAKEYFRDGDSAAGVIELKNALKIDAQHFPSRKLLAKMYYSSGDFTSAEKEARRGLEIQMDPELEVLLNKTLLVMRQFDEVEQRLQRLPSDLSEMKPDFEVLRARILLQKGDKATAARLLRKLQSEGIMSADLLITVTQYHIANGEIEQAQKVAQKTTAEYPERRMPWLTLGRIAIQQEKYKDSLAYFERAKNVAATGEDIPLLLDALYGKTVAQIRLNQLSDAIADVNAYLGRYGEVPQLLYLKGLAEFQQESFETSYETLRTLVQAQPGFSPAVLLLATVEYRIGKLEQARNHIRTYVSRNPQDPVGKRMLGELELRLNSPEKAFQVLGPLSDMAGDSDLSLLALAGESAMQSGSQELGVAYFRKAAELQPDNPAARLQYASALLRAGDTERATSLLESMEPSLATPFRREALLIQAYSAMKNPSAVRQMLIEMDQRLPDDASAQKFIGDVFLATRNIDSAEKYYQKSIQIDPENIGAILGQAQIEAIRGDFDKAYQLSLKAMDIAPDSEQVLMYHVRLTERVKGYPQAIALLKDYILSHPQASPSIWYLVQLAIAHKDRKEIESLIDYLEQNRIDDERSLNLAVRLSLEIGQLDRANRLFAQLESGYTNEITFLTTAVNLHLTSNRLELAREHMQRLLILDPHNSQSLQLAARLEAVNENYNKAVVYLEDVPEEDQSSPQFLLLAGKVYEALQQPDQAANFYRQGLVNTGNTQFLSGLYRIARVTQQQKYEQEADQWVLQHGKNNIVVRMLQADYLGSTGRFKEAVKAYEEALLGDEAIDDPAVLNNYAWNLFYAGNYEKSLRTAKRAYDLSENNPYIGDTLGWIMVNDSKHLEEGVQILKNSLDQSNNHPEIVYHLAFGLHQAGEIQAAKELLDSLLEKQEAFDSRDAAQQLLSKIDKKLDQS